MIKSDLSKIYRLRYASAETQSSKRYVVYLHKPLPLTFAP